MMLGYFDNMSYLYLLIDALGLCLWTSGKSHRSHTWIVDLERDTYVHGADPSTRLSQLNVLY